MRRDRLWPLALTLLALPLLAAEKQSAKIPGLEYDTNRYGGDYRDFAIASGNPGECLDACKADEGCRSFTFVKAGAQGAQAHCWLKSTVPTPSADGNCISGVVPRAAPKTGDLEYGVNRAGKDYRDFKLSSAKPEDCRSACNGEAACRSFTYVKPGAQGDQAHCWLKNDVPPPNPDANCVSGIAVHASSGCPCVATTCASACKNAIVLLCVAGGTISDSGAACQKCIDTNCPP